MKTLLYATYRNKKYNVACTVKCDECMKLLCDTRDNYQKPYYKIRNNRQLSTHTEVHLCSEVCLHRFIAKLTKEDRYQKTVTNFTISFDPHENDNIYHSEDIPEEEFQKMKREAKPYA